MPDPSHGPENPLAPGDPLPSSAEGWAALVEQAGPASLLVAIGARMERGVAQRCGAEDILQDALLAAWRGRAGARWQGPRAFRSWLLSIALNRMRDLVDEARAEKRGGGRVPLTGGEPGLDGPLRCEGPVVSTTPSQAAWLRERADVMRAALESLSEDLREVVRLRLFEERSVDEVAQELGLGPSAVKHRFLKGAAQYRARLQTELRSRSGARLDRNAG